MSAEKRWTDEDVAFEGLTGCIVGFLLAGLIACIAYICTR